MKLKVKNRQVLVIAGVVAAIFIVGTTAPSTSQAAHAATACGTAENNFVGFLTTPAGEQPDNEGASSQIQIRQATLCPNSSAGNTSSAWTMILENQNRSSQGALAQDGYWFTHANPTLEPYYFYEGGANDAGTPVTWHSAQTVGNYHRFWVQWVGNGCSGGLQSCFAFNVDTTRIGVSNFDPYAYWSAPTGAYPWQIQLLSETHLQGTDIAGDNNGSASIHSAAQGQDYFTNDYSALKCTMTATNTLPNRYGLNYASNKGCNSWSTYTK